MKLGLDCEWKPVYDSDDILAGEESNNEAQNTEKNNCTNTFQVSTRNKTFIIETKYLIETLDSPLIDKFGDLVLFSESITKLGN